MSKKDSFKVRAATGLKVPQEHKPRHYITDSATATVPATAYYLRRISSGELIEHDTARPAATKSKGD